MTRDEVMALSDDDLRIKAAELMGWMKRTKPVSVPFMWAPGHLGGNIDLWWDAPGGLPEKEPPNYPDDIAAAWKLVDGAVAYAVYFPGDRDRDDIWARMTLRDRECGEESGDCPGDLSAARAITRAFVLAMSQEKT